MTLSDITKGGLTSKWNSDDLIHSRLFILNLVATHSQKLSALVEKFNEKGMKWHYALLLYPTCYHEDNYKTHNHKNTAAY